MPRPATTWVLLCKHQGKLDEAIASFDQALRLKPDMAEAFNNLGMAWQSQGNMEEAQANFDRALLLKPDDANFHFNRALLLLLQRRF